MFTLNILLRIKGQIQILEKPHIKGNKTKWNNWAVFTWAANFLISSQGFQLLGPVLSQSDGKCIDYHEVKIQGIEPKNSRMYHGSKVFVNLPLHTLTHFLLCDSASIPQGWKKFSHNISLATPWKIMGIWMVWKMVREMNSSILPRFFPLISY